MRNFLLSVYEDETDPAGCDCQSCLVEAVMMEEFEGEPCRQRKRLKRNYPQHQK